MDGKNTHADCKHKKVDTTILISDKIDFETKFRAINSIGRHYNYNVYAPNCRASNI